MVKINKYNAMQNKTEPQYIHNIMAMSMEQN